MVIWSSVDIASVALLLLLSNNVKLHRHDSTESTVVVSMLILYSDGTLKYVVKVSIVPFGHLCRLFRTLAR